MKTLFDFTDSKAIAELKKINTVSELLGFISRYGDKPAIVDGREYSYSELDTRIGELRSALCEAGVEKGTAVGILYPNSFEFIAASLAVMSYGALAVALPYQLDDKTIFGCSLKYAFSALLCGHESDEKTAFLKANNPATHIIYTDEVSGGFIPASECDPESGAAVIFTAGSTGQSKGALLSHKALMTGMTNGIYGFGKVLYHRYFLVLPLTHVFGFVRNMLTNLYTGSCLYICRDLKQMFREIPAFRPTIMVMVPALAEMMLNMTRMMSPDILGGELRTIICGAAVVTPYLAKEYSKLGITLLAGYGLTESANLVSGNPETEKYPESVGLLYPDQEYKIVDGELLIKGPNVFDGYYRDPELTAAAFDEDGYFRTGDLVRFDDEGRLYIVGRSKELIVLGTGEKISPAELETGFCELECIQDSLIYLEKEGSTERLVLEVFPRAAVLKQKGVADAEGYCKEQIKKVNATLLPHQRVNKIIVRDSDFDRTPSMKIKRPQMM